MLPVPFSKRDARGYQGHDAFAIVERYLVRRFPIYRKGDTNAKPTGGLRQIHYRLRPGEAGKHAQQRGLPGPEDADDTNTLACRDAEIQPAQRRARRAGVGEADVAQGDRHAPRRGFECKAAPLLQLEIPQVRQFLDKLIPSPAEKLRLETLREYAELQDAERALRMLAHASELDPANEAVRLDSAQLLITLNRHDEAAQVLASLSELTKLDERVKTLQARIALSTSAGGGVDADELAARIEHNAGDLEARLQLARVLITRHQYAPACDHLLEIVRRDRKFNDDAARKTLLQLFSVLGDDPLVSAYRRKLASALN